MVYLLYKTGFMLDCFVPRMTATRIVFARNEAIRIIS